MIYLLDTNVISDVINSNPIVYHHLIVAKGEHDELGICLPVKYELLRGLYHRKSKRKLAVLENDIIPMLINIDIEENDWIQAADFWVDMVRQGRQLSDIDILIAAIVYQRDAILVTSDQDFSALPIKQVNWRIP